MVVQLWYQAICSAEEAEDNIQSYLLLRMLPLSTKLHESILSSMIELCSVTCTHYLFEIIDVCEKNDRSIFKTVCDSIDSYPIQFIKDLLNNASLHSSRTIQDSLEFIFNRLMYLSWMILTCSENALAYLNEEELKEVFSDWNSELSPAISSVINQFILRSLSSSTQTV